MFDAKKLEWQYRQNASLTMLNKQALLSMLFLICSNSTSWEATFFYKLQLMFTEDDPTILDKRLHCVSVTECKCDRFWNKFEQF